MKKTAAILIATLAFVLSSNSQLLVGIGAGYSTSKKFPTAQLEFGLALNKTTISAGYVTHITNSVNGGALFSMKLGRVIPITETVALHPNAGYGYLLASTDKTYLNFGTMTGGIELWKKMGFDGQVMLYAGSQVASKHLFVTIGVKVGLRPSDSCH